MRSDSCLLRERIITSMSLPLLLASVENHAMNSGSQLFFFFTK